MEGKTWMGKRAMVVEKKKVDRGRWLNDLPGLRVKVPRSNNKNKNITCGMVIQEMSSKE
jgi:hypothetical protein